jgi:DNA invertase Pin-like site-specific DNA recombinase
MATGNFVAYYRVSTDKQGRSGLGLAAQREAVHAYLNGGNWRLLAEFTEVESGRKSDREELAKALTHCRRTGARLVIAKLDRLSRDAHFLLGLDKAGVDFVAVDMPHANKLTVGIMALVAQEEAKAISARTKAALAAAKARGQALGGYRGGPVPDGRQGAAANKSAADAFAAEVGSIAHDYRTQGLSLAAIASKLTADSIQTPRGGAWAAASVRNLLARYSAQQVA